MPIKISLHKECIDRLSERIKGIRDALTDAQQAANQETKSSAGDKHETGRAMMQLETEKLHAQLEQALIDQDKLNRIDPESVTTKTGEGSLLLTDHLNLYFSISTGKIEVDGVEYVTLSINSPLGMAARGCQAGDSFTFRGQQYTISSIY